MIALERSVVCVWGEAGLGRGGVGKGWLGWLRRGVPNERVGGRQRGSFNHSSFHIHLSSHDKTKPNGSALPARILFQTWGN